MEQAIMDARGRVGVRPANLEPSPPRHKDSQARRAGAAMWIAPVGAAMALSVVLTGCGPRKQSSDIELNSFIASGSVRLSFGSKELLRRRISSGPYRLVAGDLVELQMPTVVGLLPNREGDDTTPYRCRVDSVGRIVLPIVGTAKVAGMTLSEAEATVLKAYYPKYIRQEPSIVASVAKYHLSSVSVMGAAKVPGIYELRSNELTLITALMKAGGIAEDGATMIRICGADVDSKRSLNVPVLGMNIPTKDVELADNDTIIVEAMEPQAIAVIGLVKKPGSFPWVPKNRWTVMDAIAFAGGVNDLAGPEHARIYRQDTDGKLVSALLGLSGPSAAGASKLRLKAGDIVAVEQTPLTRTRLFLAKIFHLGVGLNAGAGVGP